jgi:hypothetical protein
MSNLKLKVGDQVRFPFAGTTHIGIFEGIKEVEYGTIKRVYHRCRTKDGTLYPVDISVISKI